MATVHPSRMALIPQDIRDSRPDRTRGRSPSPRRSRSRDRDRNEGRGRDSGRGREREDYRASELRRASPQYEDYRRPPPPAAGESSAPWRQKESMYPPPQYHGRTGTTAFQSFLDERRAQRAAQTVNVWPPSPKAPTRELSPKGGKKSKKSKRRRSPSTSTSSSEEERRREKKERKRARKAREKEELKSKKRYRSRSRHRDDSDDEDKHDERDRRERRSRKPSRPSSRSPSRTRSKSPRPITRSRSPSPARMESDKRNTDVPAASNRQGREISTGPPPSSRGGADDSDEEVGPQPLLKKGGSKKVDERAYGGSLLRGEGSAMAAFLQDGTESRIPRRGEIGLTPDEIAKYEDVGYVMSGSRHRRMNAVRMRKENQVISAEEKRGILKLQREERERKEAILRDEFSQLVAERLKGQGQPPT